MERKIKLKHWDEKKSFLIAEIDEWELPKGIYFKQYRVKKRVTIGFFKTRVTPENYIFDPIDVIDLGEIKTNDFPINFLK